MNRHPKQVGRYQIVSELGRGGMATVYRAYDPQFKRTVALKILPPEMVHDQTFRTRFEREARTVASLDHPAIVPVYDYGEHDGMLFLVMRLMDGGTLADLITNQPIERDKLLYIFRRIGSALAHAHQQDIVHRDLKPENVLFDQYGAAYLADFGIVKTTGSQKTVTSTSIVGTPEYMSPEQVRGVADLDGRSDIYSLGVMLFEILTLQRPYQSDTAVRTAMMHLMEPVPPICTINAELTPGYDVLIRRVLHKDRDQRYATITELLNDLDHVDQLDSASAPAPATLPKRDAPAKPKGRPALRIMLGGLLLAVVAISAWLGVSTTMAQREPRIIRITAPLDLSTVPIQQPVASQSEYESPPPTVTLAPTTTPISQQLLELTPEIEPVTSESTLALTPTESALIAPTKIPVGLVPISAENIQSLAEAHTFLWDTETVRQASVNPSRNQIAIATSRRILLYSLPDFSLQRELFANLSGVTSLSWAPNGERLAASARSSVWLIQTASEAAPIQHLMSTGVSTASWSPRGDLIAVGLQNGDIRLVKSGLRTALNATSSQQPETVEMDQPVATPESTVLKTRPTDSSQQTTISEYLDGHQSRITALVWAPDGESIASTSNDPYMRVHNIRSNQPVEELYAHFGGIQTLQGSSNGAYVVSSGKDGSIRRWSTERWRLDRVVVERRDISRSIAFAPDGLHWAVLTDEGHLLIWQSEQAQPIMTLQPHLAGSHAHWIDNKTLLTVGDNGQTVRLFSLTASEPIQTAIMPVFASSTNVLAADWSDDSSQIALGYDSGPVQVWNINTKQPLVVLSGHKFATDRIAWSGNFIATSGQPDSSVRIWNATTGQLIDSIDGHVDQAKALVWSPDGKRLLTAGLDQRVLIWNADTQQIQRFVSDVGTVFAAAWSPTGEQFAVGGDSGNIQVWNSNDLSSRSLPGHQFAVGGLGWLDGNFGLISTGAIDNQLLIRTANNPSQATAFPFSGGTRTLDIHPTNTLFAVAGNDQQIHIWDAALQRELTTVAGHAFAGGVAWSPDGKQLAFVNGNGQLTLWGAR